MVHQLLVSIEVKREFINDSRDPSVLSLVKIITEGDG